MAWYQTTTADGRDAWTDPATGALRYDNPSPTPPPGAVNFDVAPYQRFLQYVGGSGDVASALGTFDSGYAEGSHFLKPEWLANPTGLFDIGYNQGNRHSFNPYYSTQSRDALRTVAKNLGLTADDADRAALGYASDYFDQTGQGFSDAMHPAIVADEIAKRIFAQAGKPYDGLSADRWAELNNAAQAFQDAHKSADKTAWKRDDLGSILAFQENYGGNVLDELKDNPERGLLGAMDEFGSSLWGRILGKDYKPQVGWYGEPTQEQYADAAKQGIDPAVSAFLHNAMKTAAQWYTASAGTIGDATSELGAGLSELAANAGMSAEYAAEIPALLDYANMAKKGYGIASLYEKLRERFGGGNPDQGGGGGLGQPPAMGKRTPKRLDDPEKGYELPPDVALTDVFKQYQQQGA